jgi:DNA-binding beta-propeller fold protein YncE
MTFSPSVTYSPTISPTVTTAMNYEYSSQWGSNVLVSPRLLSADHQGNQYIADLGGNCLVEFNSQGTVVQTIAATPGPGSGPGQFNSPYSTAIDPASGNIYVADEGNNRIQVFGPTGGFLLQWGGYGPEPGNFAGTGGIAISLSGFVYVAEYYNSRVQKFTLQGGFVSSWGCSGNSPGCFHGLVGVAVAPSGNVYTTEFDNERIQKFDADGNNLGQWGGSGSGPGQFSYPTGIWVDGAGYVYVVDQNNDRVQKFDSNGNFLAQFGGAGSGDGQLLSPQGVAGVNLNGNVFVTDLGNNRVEKFMPVGGIDPPIAPPLRTDATPTPTYLIPVSRSTPTPTPLATASPTQTPESAGLKQFSALRLADEGLPKVSLLPKGRDMIVFPNPARNFGQVVFKLEESAKVALMVFNLAGEPVKRMNLGELATGEHSHALDMRGFASGLYYLMLQTDEGWGWKTKAVFKVAIVR